MESASSTKQAVFVQLMFAIATLRGRASRKGQEELGVALPEQHNLKGLSEDRRRFPTGMGKSTGQASPCTLI